MATRGSYKIDGQLTYNHHDNYPTGAAHHIHEVIKKQGAVDFFSMIRGMERLQPNNGKPGKSGEEYYYEINSKSGEIKCYSVNLDSEELRLESFGLIEDWVNTKIEESKRLHAKHYPNESFLSEGETWEDCQVVRRSTGSNGYPSRFSTVAQARQEAESKWKMGVDALSKGWIGNSSSYFQESLKLFGMVGNYEDKKTEWLTIYSPLFAEKYNHETTKYFDSYIIENRISEVA